MDSGWAAGEVSRQTPALTNGQAHLSGKGGGLRDEKGVRGTKRESAGFGPGQTMDSEWIVYQVMSGAFVDRSGVDFSMTKWPGSA